MVYIHCRIFFFVLCLTLSTAIGFYLPAILCTAKAKPIHRLAGFNFIQHFILYLKVFLKKVPTKYKYLNSNSTHYFRYSQLKLVSLFFILFFFYGCLLKRKLRAFLYTLTLYSYILMVRTIVKVG